VRYLVDKKIADPDRICIMGASYGGYAASWGLVKTPTLYKCGISVAGVSDLKDWLTSESDVSKYASSREWLGMTVGGSKGMQFDFDSVSPAKHADRITAPLLLVHGYLDWRVPVSHTEAMASAMRAHDKDVQKIIFTGEGHATFGQAHQREYWAAVYKLLERTIGKGVPPFPPQAAPAASAAAP
jgi:dipeptidyl aminopeptidase/acylaminoacyl peptidase